MKEIAELLEDQLGLVHGWLMSVPCKVSSNHSHNLQAAVFPKLSAWYLLPVTLCSVEIVACWTNACSVALRRCTCM